MKRQRSASNELFACDDTAIPRHRQKQTTSPCFYLALLYHILALLASRKMVLVQLAETVQRLISTPPNCQDALHNDHKPQGCFRRKALVDLQTAPNLLYLFCLEARRLW
jgi:hypothetical protein